MVKSLTVSIESVEKGEHVSITGTQNSTEFVKDVVLTIGTYKIAVNSVELAQALKEIVDFQTVPGKSNLGVVDTHEPVMTGLSNLGWTK